MTVEITRGCAGAGCVLRAPAGGQVVGVCRCLPRELTPEDRVRLRREIQAQQEELRAARAALVSAVTAEREALVQDALAAIGTIECEAAEHEGDDAALERYGRRMEGARFVLDAIRAGCRARGSRT